MNEWGYGGVAFGNITEGDETKSPPNFIYGGLWGATSSPPTLTLTPHKIEGGHPLTLSPYCSLRTTTEQQRQTYHGRNRNRNRNRLNPRCQVPFHDHEQVRDHLDRL